MEEACLYRHKKVLKKFLWLIVKNLRKNLNIDETELISPVAKRTKFSKINLCDLSFDIIFEKRKIINSKDFLIIV